MCASRYWRSELHVCASLSLFIPIVRKSPVPSIQRAWCMCVWVSGKTNSIQPTVLPTSAYNSSVSSPHLASSVSPARSVYSESCWAQRTRPIITKWRAAALQFYIHTTAPHAFNIDGPASSEDFRVILLSWLCFSVCKMSGGEIICQGWLRKSPPEKKLRRYVSVSCSSVLKYCALYTVMLKAVNNFINYLFDRNLFILLERKLKCRWILVYKSTRCASLWFQWQFCWGKIKNKNKNNFNQPKMLCWS